MYILVVETDLPFLAEMKKALEQAGHEVAVANDGMGGWGYLTSVRPPDLLVTRVDLGRGSPPGTALGLHAQSWRPAIPVIYIPATFELACLVDPEHGAVLVKPFSVAELVEITRRLQEAANQVVQG
jgi:DNA-binding response OmpR family regulator